MDKNKLKIEYAFKPKKKLYNVNGVRFTVDERYSIIKPIGYGAYGFVCAAKDKLKGEKVAIKKIPNVFQDLVDGKRILREILLLTQLKHENIISIKDVMTITDPNFQEIYIVCELMDTDLHQVIRSKQVLTQEHYQYFIYQILRGLKYLHSARVLHRDLKPGNLLVNGNCDLKICDFGLARGFDPETSKNDLTEYVVTRWYRAPELLLQCQEYTEAIDIWSVGCIFAEMINRKPLFPGKGYLHQLKLITEALGTPKPHEMQHIKSPESKNILASLPKRPGKPFEKLVPGATKEEIDLLKKMLTFDPAKRITAKEALEHPYLRALHNVTDEPEADITFSFEYDSKKIEEPLLRELLFKESLKMHPELLKTNNCK